MLNAGPEERLDGLTLKGDGHDKPADLILTRDFVIRRMEAFQRHSKGPWSLVSWEPIEEFGQPFTVVDSNGHETRIVIALPNSNDDITVAWYWPFVKGKTLAQIADSAMEVTHAPGLTVAYWRDGKQYVESRGNRLPGSSEALTPSDRWPVQLNKMLLHLMTARLVESGKMGWDNRVQALLPQYKLPSWAQSMTLLELVKGNSKEHFVGSSEELPLRDTDDVRTFLSSAFASPGINYGFSNTDAVVLLAIVESAAGKPAAKTAQEAIFEPLQFTNTRFGPPDAGQFRSMWSKTDVTDLLALGGGQPLSASVPDLLKLGRVRLEELTGTSQFLTRESFANIEPAPTDFFMGEVWAWGRGWQEFKRPHGTWWQAYPGNCVVLGVLPAQNAVIAVALDTPADDTIDRAGPIFWRIAEHLCGWPRAR